MHVVDPDKRNAASALFFSNITCVLIIIYEILLILTLAVTKKTHELQTVYFFGAGSILWHIGPLENPQYGPLRPLARKLYPTNIWTSKNPAVWAVLFTGR